MPSISNMFGGSRNASARASKQSLGTTDEHEQLRISLRAIACLMNDDVDQAEQDLGKGDSVYHKVGLSNTCVTLCRD